jgi:TonB family protein
MYCGDDDARELLYKYCYKYDTLISEEKILQIKRTPYFNSTTDTIVYSSERNDTTIYTYYNNTRVYKKTNVKPFYSIVTLNDKKAISQAFGFSEMPDSIYISDTLYLDEDIEVIFSKTIPTVIEITPDNSKSPQIGIQNDNDLQSYIGYMVDYPQEAIDKNVQGNVIVKIVINTKGEISYTEIIHKRDELLNNATLEVIKTIALFEPAYNSKNEAVNYEIIIPITFYLTK